MGIDLATHIALCLKLADQVSNRLFGHTHALGQHGQARAFYIQVRKQIGMREAQPLMAALAQLCERLQAVVALRVQ